MQVFTCGTGSIPAPPANFAPAPAPRKMDETEIELGDDDGYGGGPSPPPGCQPGDEAGEGQVCHFSRKFFTCTPALCSGGKWNTSEPCKPETIPGLYASAAIANESDPWNLLIENKGWDGTHAAAECKPDCSDGCKTLVQANLYPTKCEGRPCSWMVAPTCLCKHHQSTWLPSGAGYFAYGRGNAAVEKHCLGSHNCTAAFNITRATVHGVSNVCVCGKDQFGKTMRMSCMGAGTKDPYCLCIADGDVLRTKDESLSGPVPDVMSLLHNDTKSFKCDRVVMDIQQGVSLTHLLEDMPSQPSYMRAKQATQLNCTKNGDTVFEWVPMGTIPMGEGGGYLQVKQQVGCNMTKVLSCNRRNTNLQVEDFDAKVAIELAMVQAGTTSPMTCGRKSKITPYRGKFQYWSLGSWGPPELQSRQGKSSFDNMADFQFQGRSFEIPEDIRTSKAVDHCTPYGAQW